MHGCHDELVELLESRLGYRRALCGSMLVPVPPRGRTLVFAGDLVDRGPGCAQVLDLVRVLVGAGRAVAVCGNHDDQLARHLLHGTPVAEGWGTEETLAQLASWSPAERLEVGHFLDQLPAHVVLAGGRLVVAHAGIRRGMVADVEVEPTETDEARSRALHGEFKDRPAGGRLVRCYDWLEEDRGELELVYGHTAVDVPDRRGGALNVDTGCVYGGSLTVVRWPEQELHAVGAHRTWWRHGT